MFSVEAWELIKYKVLLVYYRYLQKKFKFL